MKARLLSLFVWCATISLVSCKKETQENTGRQTVTIGGKEYNTVTIGNQLWISSNYAGDGGVYYQVNGVNKTEYGKYYTANEAKAIAVPEGWRLPTKDDITKLLQAVDGEIIEDPSTGLGHIANRSSIVKLMAVTEWGNIGTNASGFNALPNGYGKPDGTFDLQGTSCLLWTSSTYVYYMDGATYLISFSLTNEHAAYLHGGRAITGNRMGVRFVKDL